MVFRYDDTDNVFRIFFVLVTQDMMKMEVPLARDVFAILGEDFKILLLEFRNASANLGCHLLDYPSEIDGWPACALLWSYDEPTTLLISTSVARTGNGTLQGERKDTQAVQEHNYF